MRTAPAQILARAVARVTVESLEPRRLLHGDVDVTFDFRPAGRPGSAGTIGDFGRAYGDRGNGYAFGWNADNRANLRDRDAVADQRLDTLAHLQRGGTFAWDLQIPDGRYAVTVAVGDSADKGGRHHVLAEGSTLIDARQSSADRFPDATGTVEVTDGRLTLRPGPRAVNAKVLSVRIQSVHDAGERPTVTVTASPATAAEGGAGGAFRLARSAEHLDRPLTVALKWSGSAGSKDVAARPTRATFAAGSAISIVPVAAIDDALDESLETAKVTILTDGDAYRVGMPGTAGVLIDGTEPEPPAAQSTITVTAPDDAATEGGGDARLRFARTTQDPSSRVVVQLDWTTGTAGTADVSGEPATVTFEPGALSVDVDVSAVDDNAAEETETLIARIVSFNDEGADAPYLTAAPANASVTIYDAPAPGFSNVTWAQATSPPVVYSESTAEVVGGKLYLFGGFNGVFSPQNDVYRFDGTGWQTMADAPASFTHVGSAVVGDRVYFAGGYVGNGSGGQVFGTTAVRIYDATSDTWSSGPALPVGRASGKLVAIGRKLFYFGGENQGRQADVTTNYQLDLDDAGAGWTTRASMPMARNHITAVTIGTKVYVLGGQTGFDGGLTAYADIQIYDSVADSWSVASQTLPEVRSHTAQSARFYRGKILIVGGERAHNQPVNTVWSIDPDTLVTTTLNAFPDARLSAATGILGDKFYAFGGYRGSIPQTSYVGTFM